MPITIGDTTITGLGVGGLPSGSVTATTLANASVTRAKLSGHKGIAGIHVYTNSTRQVTSSSSNYNFFTFTFTKVSATSKVYLHTTMPGYGDTNSGKYFGVGIDGDYDWTGMGHNDTAGDNNTMFLQWRNTIFAAGSRTVTINSIPIDGSSNRSPNVVNPNSSDDNRSAQQTTVVVIYEVEP
jgi:hypothetical protein